MDQRKDNSTVRNENSALTKIRVDKFHVVITFPNSTSTSKSFLEFTLSLSQGEINIATVLNFSHYKTAFHARHPPNIHVSTFHFIICVKSVLFCGKREKRIANCYSFSK